MNTTPRTISPISNAQHELSLGESVKKYLTALQGIPADQVRVVNVEVPAAAITMLGVLPKVAPLMPQLMLLDGMAEAQVNQLEGFVFALQEAHLYYLAAVSEPEEYRRVVDQAAATRTLLKGDADALINRGYLKPASLLNYSGLPGGKAIATDIGLMVALFKDHWPQIQGKCATDLAELEAAFQASSYLLRLAGQRGKEMASTVECTDLRNRAFTLAYRCYSQLRRGVAFLRWEAGDADDIAPSLYGGRQRRVAKDEEPVAEPSADPAGTVASTPAAQPHAAPATPAGKPTPAVPSAVTSAGHPDADPFLS